MSKIISDSNRPVGSVESMTRDEIYQLFSWYGFRDPLGHELIHCQDFLDLINRVSEKATVWKGKLLGDLSDDELREAVRFTLTWNQVAGEQAYDKLQKAVGFVSDFPELATEEQAREIYALAKERKLYSNRPIAPDDPLLVVDEAVKKALGLKITITAETIVEREQRND